MKKTITLLACVSGFALVGCGPSLTLEGARAQIAQKEAVVSCQPISNVDGAGGSKEKAEIALRNKAGTMNADRVVVTDTAEAGGQVRVTGEAYSCSAAASISGPQAQ
jgi:hypothetical protein